METRFESQSGRVMRNPSPDSLDHLLSLLDGVDNSYASLTTPDGSYVQTGGGPEKFTVEIRETGVAGGFRHFKAFLPKRNTQPSYLSIGGATVTVKFNEILDLPMVSSIFQTFRESQTLYDGVSWQDITSTFGLS